MILTVDPGVNTGWAIFNNDPEDVKPVAFGVLRITSIREVALRMKLAYEFRRHTCRYAIDTMIIEGVRSWGSSSTSSAATASGDLFYLAHLIGNIECAFFSRVKDIRLPSVGEWKGQLPKEVVRKRVERITGISPPEHACDAVGIGLWHKGKL